MLLTKIKSRYWCRNNTHRCVSTQWPWLRRSGTHHTDDRWCGHWCPTVWSSWL